MLAEMDPDDWREWPEFAEIEPFGAVMDGLYHGTVAALICNVNRGKGEKGFKPEDFFPHVKQTPSAPREPRQDLLRAQLALHAWKSGTLVKRSKGNGEPPPASPSGSLSPPPGG